MLEATVFFVWLAAASGGYWGIWRLAYAQGREDERAEPCCSGHWGNDGPEMPDTDWGLVVSPSHPARRN